VEKRFRKYWENHFSTIGIIGANEASLNLLGVTIGAETGRQFGMEILDFMRDRLQKFQEETGNLYNLEATPAEGTGFRLARLDARRFPKMIHSLSSGAEATVPIYTNSTQLPVNYSEDIFEILDLQDPLQQKYTGGTVQHVFLGEATPDPNAIKTFVKTVCENYSLPYFTVTPSFSICPEHGYLSGEQQECARCGAKTEVYSRVVGYLRPVQQWNEGKRAEFEQRNHYRIT